MSLPSEPTEEFFLAPVGLFRTDTQGQCHQINEAWCEMTGLSVSESLGYGWLRALHPEDRDWVSARWAEAARSGGVFREEYRLLRPDGSVLWVEARARKLLDEQGQLKGHVGSVSDISTRKVAQRESHLRHVQMRGALAVMMDSLLILSCVRERDRIVDFLVIDAGGDLATMTSRAPEEMIGMTMRQIIPNVPEAIFQRYARVVETGVAMVEERKQLSAGRTDNWVRLQVARLGDGLVVVIKDITADKHHEAQLRAREQAVAELSSRLKTILDATVEVAIIATDVNSVITIFNTGAERMLGYSASEMIGRTPEVFHLHSEVEAFMHEQSELLGRPLGGMEAFAQRALETSAERQWTYVRKDGSTLQVSLSVSPHRDDQGRLVGYVGISMDVTARVETANALRRAAEAADAANRAKSDFLANVSHEIRTPLNGVLGLLELALSETDVRPQFDRLAMAHRSARSLLLILNDLLDFAKIEAGKMHLLVAPFRVADELDRVTQTATARAQAKGLSFASRCAESMPGWLVGDADRIRQIVDNLLDNAIKFTDHGTVSLDVRAESLEGRLEQVTFEVSDTGIGIPREKMERIFAPFEQVDGSSTRRFGGTGLGLTICSELARLMGGSLHVDSVEGQGSRFSLTLTLERGEMVPARSTIPTAPPVEPLPPMRVLLVEDNRVNQLVATKMLERSGHQVWVAENGLEALDILQTINFELVLMDVQMPKLDGMETIRRLRAQEATTGRHTPVVSLTARASKEDRESALAAGMDAYLVKPFRVADLDDAMREALAKSLPLNAPISRRGG